MTWVRIAAMKNPRAPRPPDHPSYQQHKRQMWTQILLPVILAGLLLVLMTVFTVRGAFQTGGDVARWAAISTIWLVLPVMVGGLIALAVLAALIVLVASGARLIPPYSHRAQRFFYRIEYGTKRAATMVHRPILFAHGLLSVVKSGLHKARERIW